MIAISVALFLSVAAVVTVSYAWMVLSANPETQGMQISIGGGTSILVAADLRKEVNGQVYHYPDHFSSTFSFTEHKSYAYLDTLYGLVPVSTADGIHWFIPDYYDLTDQEVRDGTAFSGTIKPISSFYQDDFLQYANLGLAQDEMAQEGSYIYLDFWAVSPGVDCTLRLSIDDEGKAGSFMISLPSVVESDDGYTLSLDEKDVSTSVRVGFLVNPDEIIDNQAIAVYESSLAYSERYKKLKGNYTEPNGAIVYSSRYRFTIYEPNGDYHPALADENGNYLITSPIALLDDVVTYADVSDRLMVQLKNSWTQGAAMETLLEQRFQSAAYTEMSIPAITEHFYQVFLGGQVDPFVTKGRFVKNTAGLYANPEQGVANLDGATDDVYIVDLEADVPQRIRMFIWIEGTDVDCVNRDSVSSLAFGIELAGSNQK